MAAGMVNQIELIRSQLEALDRLGADAATKTAVTELTQQLIDTEMNLVDLRQTEKEFDWGFDGAKPPLELFMPMTIVNPVLVVVPEPTDSYEEGCLSFPEIRGDVVRPDQVSLKFKDLRRVSHTLKCSGLLSRCVQHEVDHLNGILFIDHMDKSTLAAIDPELKALKKQTREAARKK